MLLALAKIVSRFLALMALIVAVLWWRSARHIDVLRFDWSPTEDHSVSLISRAGGLHLEYTTMRPLSTLRRAQTWTFAFLPNFSMAPEVAATTNHRHFAHLEEYKIRVPMQGIFQDLRQTQPVYQSETLPLKLISAPAWFVLVILSAPILGELFWRIRHRPPKRSSRILWLIRRPHMLAGICAALLVLLWLRGCWRADSLDIGHRCVFSSMAGQFGFNNHVREDVGQDLYDSPAGIVLILNDQDSTGSRELVLPPIEYDTHGGWGIPYWLAILPLISFAFSSTIRRRLAPIFPEGCCRRCGYDLRASPARCPECGMEAGHILPIGRAKRAIIWSMLWLGSLSAWVVLILVVAWFRSRSTGTCSLIELGLSPIVRTYVQHNDLNFATGKWPLLPVLIGVTVASIALIWLAVRSARSRP